MILGTNGLIEGVINGFIGSFTPESRVYFQQYGVKIWQHCLSTGVIAKKLINSSPHKRDAAQGYLIGLICNLGDMIIYQLLTEAFAFIHPDSQPNSFAFKELMYKRINELERLDFFKRNNEIWKLILVRNDKNKSIIRSFIFDTDLNNSINANHAKIPEKINTSGL